MRPLLSLILASSLFTGCNDIMQEVIENVVKEKHRKDSASEYIRDNPISRDDYKIIERKKEGSDSIYLVRLFLLTGEKYSDILYRNQYRDGEAKFFYKNGQLSHILTYRKDTIVGLHDNYSPDGEKRSGIFAVNGTGKIKIFHPLTHKLIYDYY
jgi:antitoxin component YwqK of YwqJK toxin-antitoxin module